MMDMDNISLEDLIDLKYEINFENQPLPWIEEEEKDVDDRAECKAPLSPADSVVSDTTLPPSPFASASCLGMPLSPPEHTVPGTVLDDQAWLTDPCLEGLGLESDDGNDALLTAALTASSATTTTDFEQAVIKAEQIRVRNRYSLSDDMLVNLPVTHLNRILRSATKEDSKVLKQRRRTLKNRTYAQNCRSKKMDNHQNLENEVDILKSQLRKVTAERDYYKSRCDTILQMKN